MRQALAEAVEVEVREPKPLVAVATPAERLVSVSYLRAFVTLLVVAHHVALVYSTIKPPRLASFTVTDQPRFWMVFPVADPAGWAGFDIFMGWNDIFFMPLMFLVSGLLVWASLARKGAADFLKQRFVRLGLPFVAMVLLGPLMYYPAYLQIAGHTGLAAYARTWLSLGNWPSGPSWFIWVLLVFNVLATVCFLTMPRAVESFGRWCGRLGEKPFLFFLALVALTQLVYMPLFLLLGPFGALMAGPFFVQGTKVLVYLLYFFVGVGVGVYGIDAGLLAREGRLARRWPLWGVAALLLFAAWIGAYVAGKDEAAAPVYAFSCAASGLFVTALFVRFSSRRRLLDSFSDNAYGIFVLHYVLLSWVMWVLLPWAAPAPLKGLIALVGALALSWTASALLRRHPKIAQVL
jgi:hypothetical protein